MKPSVAIALIICGTVMVMVPPAYNLFLQRDIINVLIARPDLNHLTGGDQMSPIYQFGCWALGAAMVVISVVQSVRLPKLSTPVATPIVA